MSNYGRVISIALVSSLLLPALPARSNPALAAVPAICATGIGCILVGTAIIGGVAYHVWQNNQTGEEYHMPIRDPEEEAESMGSPQSETVIAGTQAAAERLCSEMARGRSFQGVRWFRDNQWECIFY